MAGLGQTFRFSLSNFTFYTKTNARHLSICRLLQAVNKHKRNAPQKFCLDYAFSKKWRFCAESFESTCKCTGRVCVQNENKNLISYGPTFSNEGGTVCTKTFEKSDNISNVQSPPLALKNTAAKDKVLYPRRSCQNLPLFSKSDCFMFFGSLDLTNSVWHRLQNYSTLAVNSEENELLNGVKCDYLGNHPKRHKSRKKQPASSGKKSSEETDDATSDDEGSSESSDDEGESFDEYLVEDRKFNSSFKDVVAHLKSLRVDALVGAGLNISRSKIEDQFLGSKLRLNGQKLLKKSAVMEPGDFADLVVNVNDSGKKEVKRVRLISLSGDRTKKDKMRVKLRTWRQPVEIHD